MPPSDTDRIIAALSEVRDVLQTIRSLQPAVELGKPKVDALRVAAANTPQRIYTLPFPVKWAVFTGLVSNVGPVAIGDGAASVVVGSEKGMQLTNLGMSPIFRNIDLSQFWLVGGTIGDGISYIYVI